MPELRECFGHYLVAQQYFERIRNNSDLTVRALWADALEQDKDLARAPKDSRWAHDLVDTIDCYCTIERGIHKAQKSLYPPMWRRKARSKKQSPSPSPPISSLQLQGIETTSRTLVLDLGALHFQIQYLTHSSVQWYTKEAWITRVCPVSKMHRGFKVGLAFEFDEHVLAFPSYDGVFQPTWSTTPISSIHTDILADTEGFAVHLAEWLAERHKNARYRDTLAIQVIRDAKTRDGRPVWSGVGVYTSSEIFFLAGLSPFLTESEVFDSPSRTARLCGALYIFAKKTVDDLWTFLRPCLIDGILAPSKAHRLRYADWLYVWAKQRTKMSQRMAVLCDDYIHRLNTFESAAASVAPENSTGQDEIELYDVFEPTLIQSFIDTYPSFGPLIFGTDTWARFYKSSRSDSCADPLIAHFKRQESYDAWPFLRPDFYTTLYLSKTELSSKSSVKWRPTYTYRRGKVIWSITPDFPPTLRIVDVIPIEGSARTALLFDHIVSNSKKPAIGPLEYCGNGTPVYEGRTRKVSLVHFDPGLTLNTSMRLMQGINRTRAKIGKKGTARGAEPQTRQLEVFRAIYKKVQDSSPSTNVSILGNSSALNVSITMPPQKKRRISADKHLALAIADDSESEATVRRKRSCTVIV
ncbi:hypothetical protein PLICRDRAFT_54882 [Plicaturopsis crispa FD-325 SS-3]|nr:hypothetical protein PLICRDRAFT_54882 [Plicaturopsis crispa FD-325 SS-3]